MSSKVENIGSGKSFEMKALLISISVPVASLSISGRSFPKEDHLFLPDPARVGEISAFREVRDEILAYLKELLKKEEP